MMGNTSHRIADNEPELVSAVNIVDETYNEDENRENITLIWYDKRTVHDDNPDVTLTKASLREINNYVRFFNELDACLDYIRSISTEKVFLIISGRSCEVELNYFHPLVQIESIFVFCFQPDRYATLKERFVKIVGIYTNQAELKSSIKETVKQCEFNSATFNFSKSSQKNMRHLDHECGSFVFFQLFKEVIRHMPSTTETKADMITQCRKIYAGNMECLKQIDDFEKNYTAKEAIKWYADETFVYRIINKVLRTENLDAFFAYRFYINDLCIQIAQGYKRLKKGHPSKQLQVYRGMKLSSEELQTMSNNIGNLFSMNGFMSSSRKRHVALDFALKRTKRSLCEPVLLEIDIDMDQANKIIFADVNQYDVNFQDENEILFDIGSAFKLISCNFDGLSNVHIIRATATNQGADVASDYVDFQKKKVVHSDIDLMIGHLFADMGEAIKSRQYFESVLKKNPNDEEVACIYYYLGRGHRLKGEYEQALSDYRRSYEMHNQAQPPREVSAAKSLNGIGIVYNESKRFREAADNLEHALKIYRSNLPSYHADIAAVLNNLGNVFREMNDFNKALDYLNQALSINNKTLPSNHPSTASVLNNIGNVYFKKGEFEKARDAYERVLKIRQKSLPDDHDDILCSLDNLGLVYYQLNQMDKAQAFFERAQTIVRQKPISNTLLSQQIDAHVDRIHQIQHF